ncbi:hypothetical protein ABZP36_032066 [Zizania latifolia]
MDWDFWELELHALVGGDVARDGIHEGAIPAMLGVQSLEESSESSEASSGGYLQDAVAHWGDRCKRQRMAPEAEAAPRRPAEATNEDLHCLLQRFWDSSGGGGGGEGGHLFHDLNIMIPECDGSFVSVVWAGEDNASGWEQEQGQGGPSAAASAAEAVQVSAEQSGGEAAPLPSTSSASSRTATTGQDAAPQLQPQKATSAGAAHAAAQPGRRGNNSSSCAEEAERVVAKQRRQPSSSPRAASASPRSSLTGKEKRDTGVLYPFAVVKPLGLEGGGAATLDDVNQRILKRPARPVRHPVGQFACSPAVYAHGLGLSGKAVVSLTRIRTAGRGTITIIRTRG